MIDLKLRNGLEAALRVVSDIADIRSLIDVGSGGDYHKRFFSYFVDEVYTNDFDVSLSSQNYPGDFMEINFNRQFHVVYCSNVLEHSRNVGLFIEKLFSICEDDGFVAIMVPRPHLHRLLSGHITTWSTSTLVYNIVVAGFDCSEAKVLDGEYEKAIIVKKKPINDPSFVYRSGVIGDVIDLAKFFPWPVRHKGNGLLPSVNWPTSYRLPRTGKFDGLRLQYLSGATYSVDDGGIVSVPQLAVPAKESLKMIDDMRLSTCARSRDLKSDENHQSAPHLTRETACGLPHGDSITTQERDVGE